MLRLKLNQRRLLCFLLFLVYHIVYGIITVNDLLIVLYVTLGSIVHYIVIFGVIILNTWILFKLFNHGIIFSLGIYLLWIACLFLLNNYTDYGEFNFEPDKFIVDISYNHGDFIYPLFIIFCFQYLMEFLHSDTFEKSLN